VATRLHHIISQYIVIVTEDHDMRNCNFTSTVWFWNCYLALWDRHEVWLRQIAQKYNWTVQGWSKEQLGYYITRHFLWFLEVPFLLIGEWNFKIIMIWVCSFSEHTRITCRIFVRWHHGTHPSGRGDGKITLRKILRK